MESKTTYAIKLFAGLKAALGSSQLRLELAPGTTAGTLRQELARIHPELASGFASARVARNLAFVEDDCHLEPSDELALIPPVTGG